MDRGLDNLSVVQRKAAGNYNPKSKAFQDMSQGSVLSQYQVNHQIGLLPIGVKDTPCLIGLQQAMLGMVPNFTVTFSTKNVVRVLWRRNGRQGTGSNHVANDIMHTWMVTAAVEHPKLSQCHY